MAAIQEMWDGFWAARTEQEQKILMVGGGFLIVALLYSLAIEPAMEGRVALAKSLPKLRGDALAMESMAREAQALAGRAGKPAMQMTKENVEAALKTRGLAAQSVGMLGDQLKIQLQEVQFANLMTWLDEMQKSSQISVVDANITAQAKAGIVSATLSLKQAKSE